MQRHQTIFNPLASAYSFAKTTSSSDMKVLCTRKMVCPLLKYGKTDLMLLNPVTGKGDRSIPKILNSFKYSPPPVLYNTSSAGCSWLCIEIIWPFVSSLISLNVLGLIE